MWWPSTLAKVATALLTPLLVLAVSTPAQAAPSCTTSGVTTTCTYASTGAEDTFTVPAGVTQVQVTAISAAGAPSFGTAPGGHGAQVNGAPTGLTAGQTLYVEVGRAPTTGANGT